MWTFELTEPRRGLVSLIPEERAHTVLVRNYTNNKKINNDMNSTAAGRLSKGDLVSLALALTDACVLASQGRPQDIG